MSKKKPKKKKPPRLDGIRLNEDDADKMVEKLIKENQWTKEKNSDVEWVFREPVVGGSLEESHSVLSKDVEHIERKKLADGSVQEIFRSQRKIHCVVLADKQDQYKIRLLVRDTDSYDTGSIRDMLARKSADEVRDEIIAASGN